MNTKFDAGLTDPTKISVHQTAEPAQPVAWTTMPDADDWTFMSGHEDPNGRLAGKWFPLYAAPPALAFPARLTDEDFSVFWLASTSDVDVSKSFAALAFHYGRAVEDEVRRRMEVSA